MTAQTRQYNDEETEAKRLGVSPRTLQRWRVEGNGPPYVRVGARRVAYDPQKSDEWAAARTFAHRAAELANQAA